MNKKNVGGFMRTLIKMVSLLSVFGLFACGTEEKEDQSPRYQRFKTEQGWICTHDTRDKTTLCYDSEGHLVAYGDPNGVFR